MESLKEFILPKTFNRFSYVANVFWILLGVALSGIFLDIEINESRRDFVCGSSDDSKELIRGKCWEQYKKQINKFGIPMYGFLIVNFCLTALVLIIYSQAVKSRVEELERLPQQQNPGGLNSRKKLFKYYCGQLVVRLLLGIIFVLLQLLLLYPRRFPPTFHCTLPRQGNFTALRNVKQEQTSYECDDQRAGSKTFWTYAVIVVTGTFALLVLIEMIYILFVLPRKVNEHMEDPQFHKYYLKPNPPIDEPDNPISPRQSSSSSILPSPRQRPHFRPTRSKHFLGRLQTAKSERESMTVRKENRQHDAESQFTIEEPLDSEKEYVVTISVSPTCECEDYLNQPRNRRQLCKHILWVYLYQLNVDEEHCLIQQVSLDDNQVIQILKIREVKGILSNDKRNAAGQRRTWYLSHKKNNPVACAARALRCKEIISPGKLCVFVEGLQVRRLKPPEVSESKFYFCPSIDCLRQIPLWSNLEFPTKISAKEDVSPDEFKTAQKDGLPLSLS